VRRAFNKAQPLPGELMALGELKVEKRIIIRSIIGSPINIAIVVALLLILIGGGYWWMFSQPTPDDKAQSLIAPIEQTAIPTFEVESGTEQAGIDGMDDSEAEADMSYQGADDDSSSLPPTVVEDTASVGEVEQDQQRVVITSDVVDALLDDKPESADTSAIDAAVEENTGAAVSSQSDADKVESQPSADEATDLTQSTPPTKKITFSFSREELQAISPRAYTLQLSAMTSLDDVQSFIEEYDLENKVRIYPTLRNDTKWFIITYQDYPTIQVARDAVSALSKPLQQLEPWAKSMNQVHREIERAK
jgi:DamX protein